MTNRKRRILTFAVAILAIAGVGAFALFHRADRITKANYERIKVDMTRGEVEAILGPPGDYSGGPTVEHYVSDVGPIAKHRRGGGTVLERFPDSEVAIEGWVGDRLSLLVEFNRQERVTNTWQLFVSREQQSAGENLDWRIKRQWRKLFQ
jgi:hypothetical protein